MKTCKVCNIIKQSSQFYIGRLTCKKCFNKAKKKPNPKIKQAEDRLRQLKKYGITESQYTEMLNRQNGVCAVCKQPETLKYQDKPRRLSTDHDHQTGAIRGLLCNKCNYILGLAEDDSYRLHGLASYLENSKNRLNIW